MTATSLETPKKSSTYLSGYVCGFFVISALFRRNSQNAQDGTLFHHPAKGDRINAAHLHIILVHLPVVLTPTAAVLLAWALFRRQSTVATVALALLVASTALCVPAFLLGKGAEEVIEHLPGVSEDLIGEHEEVADVAFWLSIAVGVGSLAILALRNRATKLYRISRTGLKSASNR